MEKVFCSLYTQSCAEPAEERAALQELLLHLGQETAQQQIERHCSSVRLDRMICQAVEAASDHADLSVKELERLCREMAEASGRKLPQNRFELVHLGERFRHKNDGMNGLNTLVCGGLKGIAEYGLSLAEGGSPIPEITDYLKKNLAYLLLPGLGSEEMVRLTLDCGRMCFHTFKLFSEQNRKKYGVPRPVQVRTSPVPGKAVLVTGQELHVLAGLLELARKRDVRIYTYGELLSAHSYPCFQGYRQLAGHYGTTWRNHREELAAFPGAVLITSGCFPPQLDGLEDRCFSCGAVWSPGIPHLKNDELETVLDKAESLAGFSRNEQEERVSTGFGHEMLENNMAGIISMMERGALRHFYVVGGCDRAENGSRYFSELIPQLPGNALVLTFGCGKAHFHRYDTGRLGEFPRLLDMGQHCDIYSIIHFFRSMADTLGWEIGNLPVSIFISWNDERTIPVILTLAVSGFEEMFVGEGLPVELLAALQKIGNIHPVSSPEKDLTLCCQAFR